MDWNDCPMGEECSMHYRVDEEMTDDEWEDGRFISYRGEWVIVTETNQMFISPAELDMLRLLGADTDPVPESKSRYETIVYHVGDGVLADLPGSAFLDPPWVQVHDSYKNLKAAHEMVVGGVVNDLLGL